MHSDLVVELANYLTHAVEQCQALATGLRQAADEARPQHELYGTEDEGFGLRAAAEAATGLAGVCRTARDALIGSYLERHPGPPQGVPPGGSRSPFRPYPPAPPTPHWIR